MMEQYHRAKLLQLLETIKGIQAKLEALIMQYSMLFIDIKSSSYI